MQTLSPTAPARSKVMVPEQEPAASSSFAPSITMTPNAQRHIRETRERMTLPVKGIRVHATPRTALRLDYAIRFVPAEEPPSPADTIQSVDGIDVYIDAGSAPHLKGATIDYVFRIIGSELKVLVSFEHLETPEGRVAAKIQKVLDEKVNPSLGTHGGAAALIDYKDGIVFVELTGGCQGCSMAGATLKDGIEKSIRENVVEVQEVRDVTAHANGRNPYFRA